MSELSEVDKKNTSPEKVYVGDELNLDLWVETVNPEEKSMLIRKTNPQGETSSVLLHLVDSEIKVIPKKTANNCFFILLFSN